MEIPVLFVCLTLMGGCHSDYVSFFQAMLSMGGDLIYLLLYFKYEYHQEDIMSIDDDFTREVPS